ncbi:MAG: ParB/RepB/Spo0J family partition protein [Nitrososphaerota archaeon]
MKTIAKIEEPLHGYSQEIAIIPIDNLKVIEIQRAPSKFHIKRLSESIRKIGFVIPLVVVKRGNENIIIDGQHRFLAAKELGIKQLPAIIIPEKYAHELMELNIEKQMSLREKAYVALNVYRMYLKEKPEMNEDDGQMMDSIEFAYYVTLGIAYEKAPKLFGSAYESILKKIDFFLSKPLIDAVKEREERANIIIETDNIARKAIEKIREIGIDHPFLYKEVVSFCTPVKRKRKVEQSFNEMFDALKENLKSLISNPHKIREHKFSTTIEL